MDVDQLLAFAMGTHPRLGCAYVEMPANVVQKVVEAYRLGAAKLLVAKIDLEASTDYFPFGLEGLALLYKWYDSELEVYNAMKKHDTTKRKSVRYVIKARKLLVKRWSLVGCRSLKSKRRYEKIKIKQLAGNYFAKKQKYYKLLHEVVAFKEHVYEAFLLVNQKLCNSDCVIAGHSEYVEYRPHSNLICTHSLAAQQMNEAETDIANVRKHFDIVCLKNSARILSAPTLVRGFDPCVLIF